MKNTTASRNSANLTPRLRCKPGQLAILTINPPHENQLGHLLGLVIRVKQVVPHHLEGPSNPTWTYEGRRAVDASNRRIEAFADWVLTPIPDDFEDEGDVSEDSDAEQADKKSNQQEAAQ